MGSRAEEIDRSADNADERQHKPLPQLFALTSIRYLLALIILFVHYSSELIVPPLSFSFTIMRTGNAAVTAFFVLSGFIMTYQYWRTDEALDKRRYYLARVARIVPVYWFSLAVALIMTPISELPSPESAPKVLSAVASFVQSLFPDKTIFFGLNPPAYTISIEAIFYLTFPLIIAAVARRPLMALLLSFPISLAVVSLVPRQFDVWAFAIQPLGRATEFMLGIVSALMFQKWNQSWRTKSEKLMTTLECTILTASAFAMACVAPWFLSGDSPVISLTCKIGAATLYATSYFILAMGRGKVSSVLSWAPLLVLGESSYSMYLLHDIFIGWLRVHNLSSVPWASPWVFGVTAAFITLCSYLCFRFVEKPWRKKILSWKSVATPLLAVQAATMALLVFGRFAAEDTWLQILREKDTTPAIADVIFEDGATLDRLYVSRVSKGVAFSCYWRCGVNPSRARYLGVHVIDANNNIVKQYDHPLMPTTKLPSSGTEIIDRFIVAKEDLRPGSQIGLAVFDDPKSTLTLSGNNARSDWGNHRLLIELPL